MSLHPVQKLIDRLNRDPRTHQRYASEFCEPVPIFAVSCAVARMQLAD